MYVIPIILNFKLDLITTGYFIFILTLFYILNKIVFYLLWTIVVSFVSKIKDYKKKTNKILYNLTITN